MRAAILSNAIAAAGHALVATVDDRTVRDNLLSFGRAYLGLASLVVLRHDIRVHRHHWVAIPRI